MAGTTPRTPAGATQNRGSAATATQTTQPVVPAVLGGTVSAEAVEKTVNQRIAKVRRAYTAANNAAKTERDKAKANAYAAFLKNKDRKALNAAIRKINVAYTAKQKSLADERDGKIAELYAQV